MTQQVPRHGCRSKTWVWICASADIKAHVLFHVSLLMGHPEVRPSTSKFKLYEIQIHYNRKAKTPTRWHDVIHVTWAKAPKFQAAFLIYDSRIKNSQKRHSYLLGFGESFHSCHVMAVSSKCQCATHSIGQHPPTCENGPQAQSFFQETHTCPGPCRQSCRISFELQGNLQRAGGGSGTACGHGPDHNSLASVSFPGLTS